VLLDSIYPTHDELREATDEYLSDEHDDILKRFKKNQWQIYYEKNIAQLVSFNNFIKFKQSYICH
jgi:predicted nucleotidyltransferase